MKIYDFRCPNDHVFEVVVDDDTRTATCMCGEDARRIISGTRALLISGNGHDTAFPTAHEKWVREHERGTGNKESP